MKTKLLSIFLVLCAYGFTANARQITVKGSLELDTSFALWATLKSK